MELLYLCVLSVLLLQHYYCESVSVDDQSPLIRLSVIDSGFIRLESHVIDGDSVNNKLDKSKSVKKRAALTDEGRSVAVETTLNSLRRSVENVANMYYASWSHNVTVTAVELLGTSCDFPTKSPVAGPDSLTYNYDGVTGYFAITDDIPNQLQLAFQTSDLRRQLSRPNMKYVGCSVGQEECVVSNREQTGLVNANIFVCLFAYKRTSYSGIKPGLACSRCDRDAVECDNGLCRASCSQSSLACTDSMCTKSCIDCSSILSMSSSDACRCICRYDYSKLRCDRTASSSKPICNIDRMLSNEAGRMSVGWIALIVVSSVLILVVIIAGVAWRCVVTRRRSTDNVQPDTTDADEFGPNFVPVLNPPPYAEAAPAGVDKPPPYSYDTDGGHQTSMRSTEVINENCYVSSPFDGYNNTAATVSLSDE